MEFKRLDNLQIDDSAFVTVTDMGHLQEVQYLQHKNSSATIVKLDKERYYVVNTGEVKTFTHMETRKDSFNSLRQTFKKLRYLINANFIGAPNELHITLTYADNMTDTKQLYNDFDRFIKKVKYKYKDITTIDYINVIEPQGRGAWHCHLLLRFNDLPKIYIDNKELATMWCKGFVTIRSLKDVDNIGAYLSAYLADLDVHADDKGILQVGEETYQYMAKGGELGQIVDKITIDDNGQAVTKKVVKGGRLHLYPPGTNIYRKSKGIKEPDREVMTYFKFKKKVGSAKPTYVSGFQLISSEDDKEFDNTIIYEQYNLKRQ